MALTFVVCTIFALSSCEALNGILGKLPQNNPAGCTHTMEETAEVAATCDKAGNIKYFTCTTCGKLYLDEAGTTETTLDKTVILAKGHKETTLSAVAPTCTEGGLTEGKQCSVCNKVIEAQETVDALGHTEVDVVALAPTCTTDGYTAHTACTVCDYTAGKEIIDALSHTIVEDANIAPTCTEDGFIGGMYCSVCEEVFFAEQTVAALGHNNDVIVVVEAGCGGPGLEFRTCKRCGLEENVIIPEFHDVVEVAAKQVTCYEDGNTAYKYCTLCDWSEGKEIFIGEHKGEWISIDANYESLACTVCDRLLKREKSSVIDFESDAIYDAAGKLSAAVGALVGTADADDTVIGATGGLDAFGNPRTAYSLVSDGENKVLKVVHNHNANYAASYTYLNYTDAANTTADGKYLVLDFDLKLNSVLNSGTPVIFTIGMYDERGNAAASLSVTCYGGSENLRIGGANITAKTDGKVGNKATMWVSIRIVTTLDDTHSSGSYSTVTEVYAKAKDSEDPYKYITKSSKVTGTYGNVGANYSVRFTHDTSFASSTQKTINYYLDNLSFIRTSDTNYLYNTCAHTFSDWSVTEAVKCKTDGVATRSCTADGCGYTETEYISAHDIIYTPGKSATCAEAGYTASQKCTECDYEIESTPIAKLEHTLGAEATCTTAQVCTVCGEEIVAALGHTEVIDDAVAATCTTAGKTEGKYCSVCNEVFVEDAVIPALGHDMDDGVYLVVPNCTESGTIKYTCQRNCGHTVIEEIISKHDIVYTPGKDATCYEDGYTAAESCTLCDYTKASVVIPGGHKGEWVPVDANYEQLACTACDRLLKRERNAVIENVAFPGDTSSTRIDFTDTLHAISGTDNGGKYLVFDFDVLIGKSAAIGTTEYLFSVKVMDGATSTPAGGNTTAQFQITMKNGVVAVVGSGSAVNDLPVALLTDKVSITFRVVGVLAEDKDASGNYVSTYYLFAKETGTDGPMTLVRTSTNKSSYAGTVVRYDNYIMSLAKEAKSEYVLSVNNASFIRTNDTNYLYSECDHEMSDWTIESDAVACTTDGVATRFCTVDGCGYTETEYISAHSFTTTSGKAATCLEEGYSAYSVCDDCQMMVGKLDLPILGHELTDWFEVEGGAKLKKICKNGCGYYELRGATQDDPLTFDDGTVTDGGRVSYINVNYGEDNKTAVSIDEKSNYSISKDVVSDTYSLCVYAANNSTGNSHAKLEIPLTGGTLGNVYTLDFDIYIVPDENSTNNSSRIVTSVLFAGASYSIGAYGSKVGAYTSNKGEYGAINTWIGFRFIYTVTVNGEAALEILVRAADGAYKSVATTTLKNAAIKVDSLNAVTISSYSLGYYTYYLDNISLTCHTAGYEAVE